MLQEFLFLNASKMKCFFWEMRTTIFILYWLYYIVCRVLTPSIQSVCYLSVLPMYFWCYHPEWLEFFLMKRKLYWFVLYNRNSVIFPNLCKISNFKCGKFAEYFIFPLLTLGSSNENGIWDKQQWPGAETSMKCNLSLIIFAQLYSK